MLSPAALSIITTSSTAPHGEGARRLGRGRRCRRRDRRPRSAAILTEFVDWRLIFFVNLPVAVALAIAAVKVVPADTDKPRWRGLDLPGAVFATGSMAAIVYSITQGSSAG